MTLRPKTIQLFLPTGKPQGVKLVHVTSRIPIAIYFSRLDFADACNRSELIKSGIYFLFGDNDDRRTPVYVGESENCIERLKNHNSSKEFWQSAVVIVSRTDEPFTKCQIKYLEWFCCKEIQRVGRGKLINTRPPSCEPFISEPVKADMMEIFDTVSLLLSMLDYPIFDELAKQDSLILYCERRKAKAFGKLIEEGFLVLAGSEAPISTTPSFGTTLKALRDRLLRDKIISLCGNQFIFQEDHLFSSPSQAAAIIIGSSANGWLEWKDEKGKSLDELLRKKFENQSPNLC
jgi:hypothetical protein